MRACRACASRLLHVHSHDTSINIKREGRLRKGWDSSLMLGI